MAELIVDIKKLRHNIKFLVEFCTNAGLEITGVLKGPGMDSAIIHEMISNGIGTIAFSNINVENNYEKRFNKKPVLITLPSIHDISRMTRYFSTSFNSQLDVIEKINNALIEQNKSHKIILMVDTGDLREGVQPENVIGMVREIHEIKDRRFNFAGLGTNLGCCAGLLPNEKSITILDDLAVQIETELNLPVETVSIGGSVFLEWLKTNTLPDRINQIRLGEAIFLGNIPTINIKHENLYDDVLIFKSDVLEISEKKIELSENLGKNALGYQHEFKYKGIRKRAILNFGISATYPKGLQPVKDGLEIVEVNSNYTILDYTDSTNDLKPGDFVEFKMNYLSMLQSFISPFTSVRYNY